MRKNFATTKGLKEVTAAIQQIQGLDATMCRLVLLFSVPGLGKTTMAVYLAARMRATYVRLKAAMSTRWLLQEIVEWLGVAPYWRTSDLYRQAVDRLRDQHRLVILDEIDHACGDWRTLETIRDLHDESQSGFLLVGMSDSERRLRRYSHFYDRISSVIALQPLDYEDLASVAKQLCEVALDESALAYILEHSQGKFRRVVTAFYHAEYIAKTNGLSTIEATHLRQAERRGSFSPRTATILPAETGQTSSQAVAQGA